MPQIPPRIPGSWFGLTEKHSATLTMRHFWYISNVLCRRLAPSVSFLLLVGLSILWLLPMSRCDGLTWDFRSLLSIRKLSSATIIDLYSDWDYEVRREEIRWINNILVPVPWPYDCISILIWNTKVQLHLLPLPFDLLSLPRPVYVSSLKHAALIAQYVPRTNAIGPRGQVLYLRCLDEAHVSIAIYRLPGSSHSLCLDFCQSIDGVWGKEGVIELESQQ